MTSKTVLLNDKFSRTVFACLISFSKEYTPCALCCHHRYAASSFSIQSILSARSTPHEVPVGAAAIPA
ncbi:hypothetical protein ACLUWA_00980 [Bifidobacterium thermophilum]|uniref:hypothetical protein n=1 Tax=Bifidobacterium thermophilum TaxID=33905 RepID=UPI003991CCF0